MKSFRSPKTFQQVQADMALDLLEAAAGQRISCRRRAGRSGDGLPSDLSDVARTVTRSWKGYRHNQWR